MNVIRYIIYRCVKSWSTAAVLLIENKMYSTQRTYYYNSANKSAIFYTKDEKLIIK